MYSCFTTDKQKNKLNHPYQQALSGITFCSLDIYNILSKLNFHGNQHLIIEEIKLVRLCSNSVIQTAVLKH